jgi:hypothetical protein
MIKNKSLIKLLFLIISAASSNCHDTTGKATITIDTGLSDLTQTSVLVEPNYFTTDTAGDIGPNFIFVAE